MPFVTAIANAILNCYLRNTAITPPTATYISLHTADPGDTGTSEVTGGSYARVAATFGSAAAAKAIASTTDVLFTGMPAVTVTYVGIWSAVSGGTFIWGGAITSKTFTAGDSFDFAIGQISAALT